MDILMGLGICELALMAAVIMVSWCVISDCRAWSERHPRAGRLVSRTTGILAAVICLAIFLHVQPYTRLGGWALYQRHRQAYDTVAQCVMELPLEGPWRETAQQRVPAEWDRVRTVFRRTSSSAIERSSWEECPGVWFPIYSGRAQDDGEGGSAYKTQALVYCPQADGPAVGRDAYRIAEGWYFVTYYIV